MIIAFYSDNVNHFIETLIYWLSLEAGFKVILLTQTDPASFSTVSEHTWCLKRINSNHKVLVISLDTEPESLDYLFISFSYNKFINNKHLIKWAVKSKKIGFLSHSDYRNWKNSVKELIFNFPYYLFSNSSILQISSSSYNPYFFIRKKLFYSPSVHPQILMDEQLREKMFSLFQQSQIRRKFKFTFIGNTNPPERTKVLEQIKDTFSSFDPLTYYQKYPVENISSPPGQTTSVLWIEYGDNDLVRGLSPSEYIDALSESDFCISPLGWGGNWTHRTIEALLKGSIPILEDEDRYNLGLEDMETCITVRNCNWSEAITRAKNINEDKIYEMRSKIEKMCREKLLPEVSLANLKQTLLLT